MLARVEARRHLQRLRKALENRLNGVVGVAARQQADMKRCVGVTDKRPENSATSSVGIRPTRSRVNDASNTNSGRPLRSIATIANASSIGTSAQP